jgi:hypothetical protein
MDGKNPKPESYSNLHFMSKYFDMLFEGRAELSKNFRAAAHRGANRSFLS